MGRRSEVEGRGGERTEEWGAKRIGTGGWSEEGRGAEEAEGCERRGEALSIELGWYDEPSSRCREKREWRRGRRGAIPVRVGTVTPSLWLRRRWGGTLLLLKRGEAHACCR